MIANRDDAYFAVDGLVAWSSWEPFETAALTAPLTPGVYQMRTRDGAIVYVGMAGERRGQGLRGRLSIYRRGKGAVSGFGEAALDRALADAGFIESHVDAVREGRPARASVWAQDAIRWLDVEIRWATCATQAEALELEDAAVGILTPYGIWNRVALRASVQRSRASLPSTEYRDAESGPAGARVLTVASLTRELGIADGGNAVRRVLRAAFPEHEKAARWDPLTAAQVAHVRATLVRTSAQSTSN